ncbi:MAG: translation initiation factor IF-2 N-terminal domain-containing protein, partial [Prochlorococcaceae cyanobacterium]
MTSGGKVRIYELSRDLGLDNRDVLNAAEKLSIAAKSHSSSISDGEAAKIKALLNSNGKAAGGAKAPAKPDAGNQILSLKKAPSTPSQSAGAPASAPPSRKPEIVAKPAAPASPAKPAPSAPPSRKPEVVA